MLFFQPPQGGQTASLDQSDTRPARKASPDRPAFFGRVKLVEVCVVTVMATGVTR